MLRKAIQSLMLFEILKNLVDELTGMYNLSVAANDYFCSNSTHRCFTKHISSSHRIFKGRRSLACRHAKKRTGHFHFQ
jgi:hypothetical protein